MINLLPEQEKELLFKLKQRKLVIVLIIEFSVALLCLVLALFALKFYMLKSISYQKAILDDTQKQYQTPDFISFKSLIEKSNQDVVKTNTFYNKQVFYSNALKNIIGVSRPVGLSFVELVIEPSDKPNTLKVTLSGNSDTRDHLLAFKNSLESASNIKEVYFPPDSWIKPTKVDFFITFEILKNEAPK